MVNPESLIGKQIDQFRLDQYVASGGMGVVYRAVDTVLDRIVALKLIPKDAEVSTGIADAGRRLLKEAKAAGRLCHPNIVTIYSYGETEEFQYICMEYVNGRTLAQLLDEKRILPPEETVPLFTQILLALDVAFKEGITHRDIKPSNIMITPDGLVKVMDFGIAKLPSLQMTAPGVILGTPFYMSPEQFLGMDVDIRSDLFSLGAVLYQVLTGERPFDGNRTDIVLYKIAQTEPVPPNVLNLRIPASLAAVIAKALIKAPEQRYQTPVEMLEELQAALSAQAGERPAGLRAEGVGPVGCEGERTEPIQWASMADVTECQEFTQVTVREDGTTQLVAPAFDLTPSREATRTASFPLQNGQTEVMARLPLGTPEGPTEAIGGGVPGETTHVAPPSTASAHPAPPQARLSRSVPLGIVGAVLGALLLVGSALGWLVIANRTGSLIIESQPLGATIFVGGAMKGSTPMTLTELPPGPFSVRLMLDGYIPQENTVEIKGGKDTELLVSLVELPKLEPPAEPSASDQNTTAAEPREPRVRPIPPPPPAKAAQPQQPKNRRTTTTQRTPQPPPPQQTPRSTIVIPDRLPQPLNDLKRLLRMP